MIGKIAVRVTADRANFPLGTLFVRAGSAANIAIFGVPVRAGVNVESITLRVENVDGVTTDFAARALGGVWVVDIPAAHLVTVGSVSGGVCVFASGKGADGATTRTWNIGVGNLEVLPADAEAPEPTPGATFWAVRLYATAPTNPRRADAYIDNGELKIYNGTEWDTFGGKVVPSAAGNIAALDAQGNIEDSGVKPSDFAVKSDLPYAPVEPGKWEFSGSGYDPTKTYDVDELDGGEYYSYRLIENGIPIETLNDYSTEQALSVEFSVVTATRPSLPGHLLDRAGNRVVVSGDTTLTLPAANPGYIRDFLVRLEISGSTVPTITFAAPTGETITYETDGDEFPVPDEAGTWSYSFTENCVAHKFAVSLKKVNEVAAPQAQGGS